MTRSRRIEEGEESDAEYKRLSIQEKTSKEVDREICETIQDKENSIEKCSKVEIAGLHKDLSSGKC